MVAPSSPSPDPLALGPIEGADDLVEDCIVVTRISPKLAHSHSTPTKKRHQPVVEIPTPRKRKIDAVNSATITPKKTPAANARGIKTPSRASPTPNGKAKGGPMTIVKKQELTTPTKKVSTPVTGTSTGTGKIATPRLSGTPTLASSLTRPLPTPPPGQSARKRPRTSTPSVAKTLTFEDEIFDDPSQSDGGATTVDISRSTFLANEALKRQREARNFTYEGDVSAPKLTRSGRVVGADEITRESEEVDEYGGKPEAVDPLGPEAPVIPDVQVTTLSVEIIPKSPAPKVLTKVLANFPVSTFARRHLTSVLGGLTSHDISINPPPFKDEEKNEPLTGLVNLLKGTVERGEGNSALVVGPRGVGKTRTIARALNLLSSSSQTKPIVVRLSGLAQTNDRLAIREMGRQISEAEGQKAVETEEDDEEEENEGEHAPTTLPSHLLALLTAPSPRAIIIIIEEFDLFTEHARQALLYCLLDVVQSIKTGPVETTGRGVAVIGVTTRVDTLLLLEKRVKSRFSHRTWRIPSPLSPDGMGWRALLMQVLANFAGVDRKKLDKSSRRWMDDWGYAVEILLDHTDGMKQRLDRLASLTTDVRVFYKPFIAPLVDVLSGKAEYLSIPTLRASVISQIEHAGWGLQNSKLKGLPHPALGVLIIAKHLAYAGREEFNFVQVEEEYLRFSRTRLVGSGKVRWPIGVLRIAFDHLLRLSLLVPASNATLKPHFARVRSALSPHEVVAYFKGEGANLLGPELGNWGRMMGGHA